MFGSSLSKKKIFEAFLLLYVEKGHERVEQVKMRKRRAKDELALLRYQGNSLDEK